MKRIAVLASGGGRSLENLVEQIRAGLINAEIATVVVSKSPLGVIERAERLGITWKEIGRRTHPDKKLRDAAIIEYLDSLNVDLIVMAGWLALLPIPKHWEGLVINIHPALLPAYGGKGFWGHHVHEAVCRDRPVVSGCTVHFASAEYDRGPIILQEAVDVLENDSPDSLAARVFEAEKRALPKAINLLLSGQVSLEAGQIVTSARPPLQSGGTGD